MELEKQFFTQKDLKELRDLLDAGRMRAAGTKKRMPLPASAEGDQ